MAESSSDDHYGFGVSLSIEAMKAIFLLNGGAATAMIALTDKTNGSVNFLFPILWFGLGALFAAGAFAAGYLSQLSYAKHRHFLEFSEGMGANSSFKHHGRFQRGALVLYLAALIASASGMFKAYEEISSKKAPSSECTKGGQAAPNRLPYKMGG